MMKKTLITLLVAFLGSLSIVAQPLVREFPPRRSHHTQRLPGVNERRLARLAKMREANVALRHRQGPWRAQTQNQTKKGLVLLVEFTDVKFKNNAAVEWNNRFNQQGFSLDRHVGSVRDYFIEQSYGMLTIDFDIIGPLQVANDHDYYGTAPNNRLDDRAPEMVIEALRLANEDVDYANYDWDGDGQVDQIYVIFAGKTSSSEPGYIWPHEWYLSTAKYYGCGSGTQVMDGVYIDTYAVSNELADNTTFEGIGTACHEFSHCLGYPDFYDTDYSGGTAGQNWDLLDGGCYNGPRRLGEVPSPYTAYERWMAGWIDLIPLTTPCRVKDMPAINNEGVAYTIKNTGNSNEYYILENRQQSTFGKGNRGHGLMVWHIDYSRSVWGSNKVNADKNHQRMTFLPADGQVGTLQEADYGYYYYITSDDEAGDPYPGKKNVDEVSPLTWFVAEKYGTKTHANLIHSISETADGKINFTYGDFVALPKPEVTYPTAVTPDGFIANWQTVIGATSYNLQVETVTGTISLATIFAEDFSGFSDVGDGKQIGNSVIDQYTQIPGWEVGGLYGADGAAVRLSSTGIAGHITTPAIENKEGKLVVEFDAASYDGDESSIAVSVCNAVGTNTIDSQTLQLTTSRATYSCTFEDVPAGCKVEFSSTKRNKRLFLYNINIMDMSGTGSNVTTYTGLTTTSHAVGVSAPDLCYYRVQAVCEDGFSEWSEWMDVDIASAIEEQPVSLSLGEGRGEAFDLSGHRLGHLPQRRLYIRNGKTYLSR